MLDPNEALVRLYFERQGYLVRTRLRYQLPTGQWSDVDLCVLHRVGRDAAMVEVKGWHIDRPPLAWFQNGGVLYPPTLFPELACNAVENLLGQNDFRRVLVIPPVAEQHQHEVQQIAQQQGVQILEWPEVLRFLINNVQPNENAASESENVIRVLRVYGFLPAG